MNAEPLLELRFIGPLLERRSMPIYELGETFIALQRIVHKAFLYQRDEYEPGTKIRLEDRRALALSIGGRKKGSDLYEIYRFLTDPDGLDLGKQLIPMVLYGLGAYAAAKLAGAGKQSDRQVSNMVFVSSIHPEVTLITDRVGNIADVRQIEIAGGAKERRETVTIDSHTREYVRSLTGEIAYGRPTTLKGVVVKLLTQRLAVDIQIRRREFVRLFMDEALFEKVRFSRSGDYVEAQARPILRFGQQTRRMQQFEASSITHIREGKRPQD